MALKYRVVGHSSVRNDLRKAAATSKDVGKLIYAGAQQTRRKLKSKPYPSYLSHFRHKRTGLLANSWAVEKTGKNAWGIVNRAKAARGFPYPVVVVGDTDGKRRGRANHPSFKRWWIAREVIDEDLPQLRKDIEQQIIAEGNGEA